MAKRMLALLLALMMAFALTACGDNNTTDPDKDTPGTSQSGENNDDQGESTDNGSSEGTTDPGTSGSTAVLHELFDIEQLADIPEFPDYAKKAIGDLRWCDDLGSDSFGKYHFNAYMKEVTQEDFETYIANLNANAPNNPIEGEDFAYYWDWGQITGTYFPDSGTLDVILTAK